MNSISVIAQIFMNCYSTFVENIFNYYEGGPYSPTVHITPNSPIAKSILISQNRGFIVKRRHIKFCLLLMRGLLEGGFSRFTTL